MFRIVVPVAILAVAASSTPVAAQPASLPALSRTVNVDGREAIATYHFDHNAIEDAVLVEDELIALTTSGNLLRVSTTPLALLERQLLASRGTAIARDDAGAVLVGTQDGQILEIDRTSLVPTVISRVRGRVAWLDRRGGRLVIVVEPHFRPMTPGEDLGSWANARDRATARWTVVITDKMGVRTLSFSSSPHPSGFHIDRHGMLWIAGNDGEFGGGLTWIDLVKGSVRTRELERAVVGFLESDRVFAAFGGLNHLGSTTSFMTSVSPDYALSEWVASAYGPETVPAYPVAPILDMEVDSEGHVWALSGGWLFGRDSQSSAWTRGPRVNGHRLIAARNSPMLFAVSSEGGISRIAGHDMSTLSFGGQLPEEALGLWDTPSGLRVLTMPRYGLQVASAWRLLEGAWTPQRLCPETYDDRRSYPGQVVHGGSPVASDTTGTFAVCAEPPLSHTERLLRSIRSGEWDTIAEWTETLSHGLLPAPDGSWLSADPLGGVLKRLVGRGWEAGGVAPAEEFTGFMRRSLPEFVVVWQSAPNRAIYHATKQGRLLELTRRPDGRWRLERMNRSAISSVWDAARDGDDAILVASPRGLFRYLPGSSVLTRLPSPPSDRIVSITRDTSGRLWAVGDHVHVSADEGRSWLAVEVPADSTAEATLVRPYPGAAGAVVVMTSSRGVVVIAP